MLHPTAGIFHKQTTRDTYQGIDLEVPSTWLVAPYFMIYFLMYIINATVWPLQLLEQACVSALSTEEAMKYTFTQHAYNQVSNSCISYYMVADGNKSFDYVTSNANSLTLYIMIMAAFGGGLVSLLSYFLIWKPLLTRWRSVAIFFPPICMLGQSLIFVQAQAITDFETYKYTMLSGALLPSLHCGFHGVLLQMYHMSEMPEVKSKREILSTRLDGSHLVMFVSILFAGCFIAGCFDLTYNLLFFLQFTLGSVNVMYAITLLPTNGPCMGGVEEDDEEDGDDGESKGRQMDDGGSKETRYCGDVSDSSTEELFLGDMAKSSQDEGLLTRQTSILKEAPLIFSETSYKMELIIIIEISVFTAAIVSDSGISGLYFVQSPFSFDLRVFGGCIAAQGLMKISGMVFMKILIRYSQVKHGKLITIALLNYIAYYIALSLASSKTSIALIMFTNVFGGLALPTLFSYIKVNIRETEETVLEVSVISSIVVTMGFNALEYFIYEKTRALFQGTIFALTASLLAICGIIILATYFSTTKKNQRKSKFFADQLLNNNN